MPRRPSAGSNAWKAAAVRAESLVDESERLRAERDLLLSQLGRARSAHPERIYVSSKKRPKLSGDFVRVIIPDTHGAHVARHALAAVLADVKRLDPAEVILLGDHLDCGGFLAQHHTLGFVAECDYSYEDDVKSANAFLDNLQTVAPRAKIYYLEGNHEARVERYCVTSALRNRKDSRYLLSVFGPRAVLALNRRGIDYYQLSGRYHNLPVPGTIRLGKCCFTHGITYATHSAHLHAQRFGISVCFGHIHRAQSTVLRTVSGGPIGAWCFGCVNQLQPLYEATRPTDWTHGYGVQLVSQSGRFLTLSVPIIDGSSLLMHLPTEAAAHHA